jgi:hypothetical protein
MTTIVKGMLVAVILLGGSTVSAQQDPLDLGLQDSIFIEVTQTCLGEVGLVSVDVYFFNDAQTIIAGSLIFAWNYPGLEFDSLVSTPEADSAFDMVVGVSRNLSNTNHYQALGAIALDTFALNPSPVPQKIATYLFHLNEWQEGDSIHFDTISHEAVRPAFVDTKSREYLVAWRGRTSIELKKCNITSTDPPSTDGSLPNEYALSQNYPNPFNPSTVIDYALPTASQVELTVFNVLGQRVAVLVNGPQSAGSHTAFWDGRNDAGTLVASGVYLYRLSAEAFTQTRKMLLLK